MNNDSLMAGTALALETTIHLLLYMLLSKHDLWTWGGAETIIW